MEQVNEFLSWYLAPWRKMGRPTFCTVLGVATLLPMVVWLMGLGGGSGGGGGGMMDMLAGMGTGMNGGVVDPAIAQKMLAATAPAAPVAGAAGGFNWSVLANDVVMLALLPLVRMRLRDMGIWEGVMHWGLVGVIYAAVFFELLGLVGLDVGLGMVAAVLQFGGLGWLMLAKSGARVGAVERESGVERF